MEQAATPSSGQHLVPGARNALSTKAPGALDYVPADKVGFEHVPSAVLLALQAREVLAHKELASYADAPLVKRRPDRSHYQLITGWWMSKSRLVTLEVRGELTRRRDGRFRPEPGWQVDGTVDHFPSGLSPVKSTWHREVDVGTEGETTPPPAAESALEVLPAELVAPVIGGVSHAWITYSSTRAEETIVALRVFPSRVRGLQAKRKASSEEALSTADWKATALDALIAERTSFSFSLDRPNSLPRNESPRPLKP